MIEIPNAVIVEAFRTAAPGLNHILPETRTGGVELCFDDPAALLRFAALLADKTELPLSQLIAGMNGEIDYGLEEGEPYAKGWVWFPNLAITE